MGETAKVRKRLSVFCSGVGLDLGFGGDPINDSAITLDVSYFPGINIIGDARILHWFSTEALDYVYSSHLLEDFEDISAVLNEWFRVLRPGGFLVLYLPVERIYREFCEKNGLERNIQHKNENLCLDFMLELLKQDFDGRYEIVHSMELSEDYCFDLVIKKIKED